MTSTEEQEYRRLERESSNLLMEQDARRALGQDAESRSAARRAGELRQRMGQIRYQSGAFVEATEDWLSAAACYLQADMPGEAQAIVPLIEQMERQGCIPSERADLLIALRSRKRDIQDAVKTNGAGAGAQTRNGPSIKEAESVRETE